MLMQAKVDRLAGLLLVLTLALAQAGPVNAALPSDAWVTTKVKVTLLTDAGASTRDVNVDTIDGRVTLHGVVGTQADKARAEQIARGIDGVREVRSLIQVLPKRVQGRALVSDAELEARVAEALKADPALAESQIEVQSVNAGAVLLSGKARTLSDAYRSVAVASRVDGVVRVESEIESPDELGDAELWREGGYDEAQYGRSAARDLWITTATKLRLMANTETPAFDINVDTADGIVTLFGVVESERARQKATREALEVDGVRQVVNDLQVVPAPEKDRVHRQDADLEQSIEKQLETRDALSDSDIEVEVSAGVARLTGRVTTRIGQVTALTIASSTPGVRRVIDDLRLDAPTVSGTAPGATRPASADPAPLWDYRDPALQGDVDRALRGLRLDEEARRQRLAVALIDLRDLDEPRVAAVNGDVMMYAASLPKIAVLLGAFDKIAQGKMALDPETELLMRRMIRESSNSASTELMTRVGKEYIARVLLSPRYRLYDPRHNGGLWVGKDYARAGLWRRDPLHNLSHGATAMQVARFYYLLETGKLVSPEHSRRMKEILSDTSLAHKFVAALRRIRPDAQLFRKSGSWGTFHSDSVLVERRGRSYIAVALSNDRDGPRWLERIIVALDGIVFRPAA